MFVYPNDQNLAACSGQHLAVVLANPEKGSTGALACARVIP